MAKRSNHFMQFYTKTSRTLSGKQQQPVLPRQAGCRHSEAGFVLSLTEVLISVVIVAITFGAIITGYLSAAKQTEWSGYSLAATSLGVQMLEQARSAVWDIANNKNELTNLTLMAKSYTSSNATWTGYTTNIMDVPWKGTNYVMATNFVSIQDIFENNSGNVPVHLQVLRVDTVWPFNGWANFSKRMYTNSICTFIAPDNRGL